MNECISVLTTRRSVKSYQDKPVPQELLETVLAAGVNAPTGRNMQSPVMVVVTNRETIREIERLNAKFRGSSDDVFYGAPVVVIVFADSTVPTHLEDGSLVMGNLLNAAASLNLGACWIHRAREVFDTPRGRELMQKWGLDDKYVGIGNCILGYAKNEPQPKEHKENYIIFD